MILVLFSRNHCCMFFQIKVCNHLLKFYFKWLLFSVDCHNHVCLDSSCFVIVSLQHSFVITDTNYVELSTHQSSSLSPAYMFSSGSVWCCQYYGCVCLPAYVWIYMWIPCLFWIFIFFVVCYTTSPVTLTSRLFQHFTSNHGSWFVSLRKDEYLYM